MISIVTYTGYFANQTTKYGAKVCIFFYLSWLPACLQKIMKNCDM